jgi:membrane protease YdiL (CAAX protease family)
MHSAPMTERRLGAGSAILAYVALLLGFIVIGIPVQQYNIVAGLWITEALAIALPAVAVIWFAGLRLAPYLGLRAPTGFQLLIAAVVAAANQPIVSLLTYLAHEGLPAKLVADFDAKQRMLDGVFAGHALPMIITVAIAAPLGEELFFRGFALPALRRSWGALLAVLVSGALFSALHLDPVGFIGLLEIGVMLALLRIWSGSLWPSVLAHAVNNGIAGAAFMMGFEYPDAPPPRWVLLLGVVLLIGGVVLAVRVLLRHRETPVVEEDAAGRARWAWALSTVWAVSAVLGALRLLHRA